MSSARISVAISQACLCQRDRLRLVVIVQLAEARQRRQSVNPSRKRCTGTAFLVDGEQERPSRSTDLRDQFSDLCARQNCAQTGYAADARCGDPFALEIAQPVEKFR
jgi:hypothetical protein